MIAEASGIGTISEFLQPLERFGCRRLDGRVIPSIDAQVDHVLIAPPGVFVISAKPWDGTIEIVDGVLRRNDLAQIGEVVQLVDQASAVSNLLDSWTGESVSIPVHAVLALVGPTQIDGWAALTGAHAVDGKSLAEFITKFPAAVGIEHVNWAYQALDDHLPIRIPKSQPVASAPVVPLQLVPMPTEPEPAAPVDAVVPTDDIETVEAPETVEPVEAPAATVTPLLTPVTPVTPVAEEPTPAPPVVEVPSSGPPPVAVAPPMTEATRQAPNEPIVFLTRTTDVTQDRFDVRDEEGYSGGSLDLRTGQGANLTSIAGMVFRQLLPSYLPDNGTTIDALTVDAQAAIRYFLATQPAAENNDDPSIVACAAGHSDGRARLYASLLQSGGRRTDLGWIDLADRRTSSDVPGVDPILRYCGDAYLATAPR